jgi:hypothetical protein
MKRNKKHNNHTPLKLDELEEVAFYESGLSAHGCLEKLDSYTRQAILRYGRYLLRESYLGEHEKFLTEVQERLQALTVRVEVRTEMLNKLYEIVKHIQTKTDQNCFMVVGSPLYAAMIEALKYYDEKIEKPKQAKKKSSSSIK